MILYGRAARYLALRLAIDVVDELVPDNGSQDMTTKKVIELESGATVVQHIANQKAVGVMHVKVTSAVRLEHLCNKQSALS